MAEQTAQSGQRACPASARSSAPKWFRSPPELGSPCPTCTVSEADTVCPTPRGKTPGDNGGQASEWPETKDISPGGRSHPGESQWRHRRQRGFLLSSEGTAHMSEVSHRRNPYDTNTNKARHEGSALPSQTGRRGVGWGGCCWFSL